METPFDKVALDKQVGTLRANQAKWVQLPLKKKTNLLKQLVMDLNSTKDEVVPVLMLLTLAVCQVGGGTQKDEECNGGVVCLCCSHFPFSQNDD